MATIEEWATQNNLSEFRPNELSIGHTYWAIYIHNNPPNFQYVPSVKGNFVRLELNDQNEQEAVFNNTSFFSDMGEYMNPAAQEIPKNNNIFRYFGEYPQNSLTNYNGQQKKTLQNKNYVRNLKETNSILNATAAAAAAAAAARKRKGRKLNKRKTQKRKNHRNRTRKNRQ
jgi:hypothetical protein